MPVISVYRPLNASRTGGLYMAEIKSTLDLIMEKTKHLSLNDEEKQALEDQQLNQRVQVPLLRYLKEERDADYLAHELDSLPLEKREEGRRLCLELFVDSLSPFEDNTRTLSGVERLLGKTGRERWEKIVVPLEKEYRDEREAAQAETADRLLETLAAAGLRGSALLPYVDGESPHSREEKERSAQAFRARVKKGLNDPQR
jgi:hypothetical protein